MKGPYSGVVWVIGIWGRLQIVLSPKVERCLMTPYHPIFAVITSIFLRPLSTPLGLYRVNQVVDSSGTKFWRRLEYCSIKVKVKADIALHGNPISELRDVTCHMGSHSVSCHLAQVNAPRLTPAMQAQAGTRFIYPGGMEGWVDLVGLIVPRPGVEPVTFRSRVWRRTAAPRKRQKVACTWLKWSFMIYSFST